MTSKALVSMGVLVAAVFAVSCGGSPSAPSATSPGQDPAPASTPPTSPTSGPSIALSGSLDFGTVQAGSTAFRTLTIANTGASPLTWRIESLGDASAVLTPEAGSGTVPPSPTNCCFTSTVTFSFTPAAGVAYSGVIIISSNDGSGDSKVSHSYSGIGSASAAPAGVLSAPSSFDFGNVPKGSHVSKALTFTNTGTAPITVNRVQTNISGDCSVNMPYPSNVKPNATDRITVNCAFSQGTHSGELILTSDASNAQVTIPMSGSGR